MTKTVPFNDLTRIHNSIEDKVMNKFSKIVKKFICLEQRSRRI